MRPDHRFTLSEEPAGSSFKRDLNAGWQIGLMLATALILIVCSI